MGVASGARAALTCAQALPRARAAIALSRGGVASVPRMRIFPLSPSPPLPARRVPPVAGATRALPAPPPLIGRGRGGRPIAAGVVAGWAGGGSVRGRAERAERR